jgi:two-component system cell cycle sensor histidine kinase/response regulator CckA
MTPLRVLLIEDNADDAALIRAQLASAEFVLTSAADLRSGTAALHSGSFDVVLLDLMLPDSAGLDSITRVRHAAGQLPIVVLTGLGDEQVGVAAVQTGAEDYLIKGQVTHAMLRRSLRHAVERRRTARSLEFQARLLDQVEQAVVALNAAGGVTYWNAAAERLFGWDAAEVAGRPFTELSRAEPGAELDAYESAARAGATWTGTLRLRAPDDTARIIALQQSPLREPPDRLTGFIAIASDITERRREDEAARATEQRLRLFIEQMPTSIWTTDLELRFTSVMGSMVQRLGLRPEDIVGHHMSEFTTDAEGVAAAQRALQGETVTRTAEYGRFAFHTHLKPLRDPAGDIIGTLGIVLDVTERFASERAAAEYADMLRAIFETAPIAIIVLDENGDVSHWNNGAERMFGWRADEVIGRPPLHVPDSERVSYERRRARFRHGQDSYKEPARRHTRDGTMLDVTVTTAPLRDASGRYRGTVGLIEDVTAQEQARQRQERLTAIIEASPDFVGTFDVERRALYINGSGRRLLGIGAEQPGSALILDGLCTEATMELLEREALPRALAESTWAGEAELRTVAGVEIPVWLTLVVHRATEGRLAFISAVAQDTSERRLLEEQLRQSQKMEAVGRLAGGVAHEFNNLLTAIAGHAAMLRDQPGSETANDDIDAVLDAVARASALTRQLLAFSRRQVLQPKLLDVNHIVTEMGRMLRGLIGESIELVTDLDPRTPLIRADRGQIEQVVLNLVVNARDATSGAGTIELCTLASDVVPDSPDEARGIRPGEYAEIRVRDDGHGMEPELLSRIFEPFFTTREQGQGTGLGLPTVYGIVTQSGGRIIVDSEPGTGSTFRVLIPAAGAAPSPTSVEPAGAAAGGETVLLVEDEAAVRRLGRRILERRGYTVLEAESGPAAIQIFERRAPDIALLVSDVIMPGMSGGELARQLRAMKPSLRVLFTSGYTADAIAQHGVLEEGTAFLEKPFTPEVLAQKVGEVLRGES